MSTKTLFFIFVLSLLIFANPVAISGKASHRNLVSSRSPGEGLVINALQQIYAAENTYFATVGNGRFGSLEELGKAGLIDTALASGIKYNFRFQVIIYDPTETHPAAFTAAALAAKFFYRNDGFVIDQTGVIRVLSWHFWKGRFPEGFTKN